MATPYWATEYTFAHMDIEPELKENVAVTYYEAGHMMYLVGGHNSDNALVASDCGPASLSCATASCSVAAIRWSRN